MVTITIQDIQNDPLGYLRRVEAGETFIIVRNDLPIAEIKPLPTADESTGPRAFGLCRGEFVVPLDFDAPLPSDILDLFEGK